MAGRDGHVRVLPIHVANKIAAGEVVERPASVVKELVENALDAGAKSVKIAISQGGRRLVSVQDDGCGMTRDDAVLSLERQATSKILDVDDIEAIDTLGFRGEAIPSIASVSRFSITTRRRDSDEGTFLQVNAGTLAEVRAAGCPPGTLVEVRDLFCNVPARRKFLRAYATEEAHVRNVFTVHALAHPAVGFSLTVDGREAYRLSPSATLAERVAELFGPDFLADSAPVDFSRDSRSGPVSISGFIEKPNLSSPVRREQYVFVNSRPATAPSIAYAIREAHPKRQGDARPAAILFVTLPPSQVDVNVHPTKREVRFRDNAAVRAAMMDAIAAAVGGGDGMASSPRPAVVEPLATAGGNLRQSPNSIQSSNSIEESKNRRIEKFPVPSSSPVQAVFSPAPPSSPSMARPWRWFKYLAVADSGFLLVETDAGIVTVNPQAARERIAYEALVRSAAPVASQTLLIPDVVKLPPSDAARIRASLRDMSSLGFAVEEFGRDAFKVDAVPQMIGDVPPASVLATVANDLAEGGAKRGGERWRCEMIAKSVAKSYAGASKALAEPGAVRLVEELASCRMPYVCPRGKPTMIFTSTRELNRKFGKE